MNVTFVHSGRLAQIRNLVSLARRQNHIAVARKQWAMEAERAGKTEAAAKWFADARRLRLEAVFNLEWAQRTKDNYHVHT